MNYLPIIYTKGSLLVREHEVIRIGIRFLFWNSSDDLLAKSTILELFSDGAAGTDCQSNRSGLFHIGTDNLKNAEKRNSKEHSHDTPNESEHGKGNENDKWTEVQCVAGKFRIDEVSNHILNQNSTDRDNDDRRDVRCELDNGHDDHQNSDDDASDGWDEVENHRQNSPQECKIKTYQKTYQIEQTTGDDTHKNLDGDVLGDLLDNSLPYTGDPFTTLLVSDEVHDLRDDGVTLHEKEHGHEENDQDVAQNVDGRTGDGPECRHQNRADPVDVQAGDEGHFLWDLNPFAHHTFEKLIQTIDSGGIVRNLLDQHIDSKEDEPDKEKDQCRDDQNRDDGSKPLRELGFLQRVHKRKNHEENENGKEDPDTHLSGNLANGQYRNHHECNEYGLDGLYVLLCFVRHTFIIIYLGKSRNMT